MKIRRIALVELAGIDYINIYALVTMPRGVPLLAAEIQQATGHKACCYVESIRKFNWQELLNYDVVGFSMISCTANPTYTMIKKLRSVGYHGTIVVGGPHATALPEESLNTGADFVVKHEGDKTFPRLIQAIGNGGGFEQIRGIVWKDRNGIITNNPDEEWLTEQELSSLPLPAYDSIIGWEEMGQIGIGFSRGCPRRCKFCAVRSMFGKAYRHSTLEWRLGQLRQIKAQYSMLWQEKVFFFYDDNFFGDSFAKPMAIEFLRRMVQEELCPPKGFVIQATVNDITPEIASLLKSANCITVCLGIESADTNSLKALHKGQSPEHIRRALTILKTAGIDTLAMTISGNDTDTFWSFFTGIRKLKAWGCHWLQVLNMIPLPGTELTEQFDQEGRSYSKDYNRYNGHHVLFKPAKMTRFGAWLGNYGTMFWFYFLTKHGREVRKSNPSGSSKMISLLIKQALAAKRTGK